MGRAPGLFRCPSPRAPAHAAKGSVPHPRPGALVAAPRHARSELLERAVLESEVDRGHVAVKVHAGPSNRLGCRQVWWAEGAALGAGREIRRRPSHPPGTSHQHDAVVCLSLGLEKLQSASRPQSLDRDAQRCDRHGTEDVDVHPTQPVTLTRPESLDRPGEQCRRWPGVLPVGTPGRGRPRAAGERRVVELFVEGLHEPSMAASGMPATRRAVDLGEGGSRCLRPVIAPRSC